MAGYHEMERQRLLKQQGMQPQAAPQPSALTQGAQYGSRGFKFDRAMPSGQGVGVSSRLNPATGLPYQTYQEWAQVNMPQAFAQSKFSQQPQIDPALVARIKDPYGFSGGR